jgi:hypothetical protein
MSVVLVGGHDRMHSEYKDIADRHGCRMKVFTQMPARFGKNIGVPDAIILLTNTVSHKMVRIAIKEAKKKKIKVLRCHTSSGNSLEETLKKLKLMSC